MSWDCWEETHAKHAYSTQRGSGWPGFEPGTSVPGEVDSANHCAVSLKLGPDSWDVGGVCSHLTSKRAVWFDNSVIVVQRRLQDVVVFGKADRMNTNAWC